MRCADKLIWAGNVVARRREMWKETKLKDERCTSTMYVKIVIDNA